MVVACCSLCHRAKIITPSVGKIKFSKRESARVKSPRPNNLEPSLRSLRLLVVILIVIF